MCQWVLPAPRPDSPDVNYSIPSLEAVLEGEPIDPTLPVTITVRGNTSLSSFKLDLYVFLLKSALGMFDCVVPEEQVFLTAIELPNLGGLDRTVELLISGDVPSAQQEFLVAVDEFLRLAAVEITEDCEAEIAAKLGVSVVGKILLLADLVGYAPVLGLEYGKFQGQPAEVLMQYDPAEASEVIPTEELFFEPTGVTGREHIGDCWATAIAAPRKGAWRCMTDIGIYDPCFEYDNESGAVICGAAPWDPRAGFKLNFTTPLPEFIELDWISAWFFELEDGTICHFLWTGTTVFTRIDDAIIYGCDDGWVILGWPAIDRVWTAEKARLSADNSIVEETEIVAIRKVWR